MYSKSIIYYLSGTGNSYRVATWQYEAERMNGINTQLIPIQSSNPKVEIGIGPESLVTFVYPTHGFTTPWLMLRSVFRLPTHSGAHAVVVATRAGTKFRKLFFPGLEGTAAYLIALILALKGYSMRGVMGLDMPSNWTALHPGFSPTDAQAIIDRSKPKAFNFINNILLGKRQLQGLFPLLLGMALLPVSLGYLLIGRFFLSKLFFATSQCNGCGLCAQNCPVQAIILSGKKTPRPYWTFACESCMRCMNFCPTHAIEASHLLALAMFEITSIPVWMIALNWLAKQSPILTNINGAIPQFILQYLYILASIALTYAIFSQLIRLPAVNKFFTFATLTHYYRRYREPGTKLSDMKRRQNSG
jgi:ferredoxin